MQTLVLILTLLGSVALFLFGLNMLSGGLQKVAGEGMRAFMSSVTSSRIKGILTGIGVTALIQSSTATTIMVVSFVNAGLLTLAQAIGVIMGANIGTTVTSWIMAIFGFSYDISTISLPLIAFGFLLTQTKGSRTREIGRILIGFALFFVGFAKLRSTASVLLNPESFTFLQSWTNIHLGNFNVSVLIFLLIGTLLTVCFQSSAATMAIIMLLITQGIIPFKMAAAMILGENIGTTIAANVAASIGNTTSKRAALAHTFFNVFGVIWVLSVFPWFLNMVGSIVSAFGFPNPNTVDFNTGGEELGESMRSSLLYSVTTMHTIFNVLNTCILVWFIPQIEKIVSWVIPQKTEEEVYRLKYIQGGPLSTAELSIDEARQEIIHFGEICSRETGFIRDAVKAKNNDELQEPREKLIKYEGITDKIEYEIATYLNEVTKGEISAEAATRVKVMYRIIGEMESIGDSGEAIGRMMKRTLDHGKHFDDEMLKKLDKMLDLLDAAFKVMIDNLKVVGLLKDETNAEDAETNINEYRNTLREEHFTKVEQKGYNYQTGVFFMDIVAELEKIGDFIVNISQCQLQRD
ncbi:MAG: Na/Pi cotransporter family protein [Bacteroidales bacterium]|jgi:phosphate:Na+ symporter|nr:Na/Pi cotransporter family protein [Bacteroidales bacterium]MCI2135834.1 Na/Pi cotransporter family protein [Bacteroidales bacterium]MEE3391050.1 Na/Pi cotransporter family protein [Candidatus Cryptobacteroides sp.]MEE3430241.1 Na/Pi cotransporter family protein [Candidatus Cryptobacteroides sp.]